jgi:hypothetical protein
MFCNNNLRQSYGNLRNSSCGKSQCGCYTPPVHPSCFPLRSRCGCRWGAFDGFDKFGGGFDGHCGRNFFPCCKNPCCKPFICFPLGAFKEKDLRWKKSYKQNLSDSNFKNPVF